MTQLFLYGSDLLLKEIFALLLVEVVAGFPLYGGFQLYQLVFAVEDEKQAVGAVVQVANFQQFLLFLCPDGKVTAGET
ncbi:hypothetical protein Barb7_02880 [Bacteroidales bacterium Barb7]|nr:hypothetical protein Barb7_02880 [Bacteroidales bacterium Barb7]